MLQEPLIAAPAADPWIIFHDGAYFFCESRGHRTIHVRRAKNILDIGRDPGVKVWTPPVTGPNSQNVWAPELHFISGKWYIYFAADDGQNENHRMWVLEADTDDPQGTYSSRGVLQTGGWAIDGSPFQMPDGKLYFVWSGWPGQGDGHQNIYLAPMSDPATISGERILLAEPEHDWERVDMPICEGPQILRREGRTFLLYSASGSWTMDYCQGILELTGTDVLNRASWKKIGQVFHKNVGHCSFVKSPCQTEDWILFHAKSKRQKGWLDREVHARRFTWRSDGLPAFAVETR
jgi:GH43 family beta-xylosidase